MPLDPPSQAGAVSGMRRWVAAGMLVVGAVLAAAGLFLPWVRVHYPAVADEPASTFYDMPGPSLAQGVLAVITGPYRFGTVVIPPALLFFGVPLFLAAVGVRALLRSDWLPRRRVRGLGMFFALAGGIASLLMAYALVNVVGSFDVVRATRTPQPGAAVTVLGYLCALGALIQLPSRARAAEH